MILMTFILIVVIIFAILPKYSKRISVTVSIYVICFLNFWFLLLLDVSIHVLIFDVFIRVMTIPFKIHTIV